MTTMVSPISASPRISPPRISPKRIGQRLANGLRRAIPWVLFLLMLASAAFAGVMYEQQRRERVLSPEFRGSAQQAYMAIANCETYRLYPSGGFYESREMDAEKAVSVASAMAHTHADQLAAVALTDYLHGLRIVRMAWEHR